jgi:ketosteroid isomerase-like protein
MTSPMETGIENLASSEDQKRMASSVVDRLVDAINRHDLERVTDCFAPTFAMVWPAHPARSFTGRDGVRRNWEAIFQAHPEIQVTLTTRAQSGDEIWGEWEFKAESRDGGPTFWQRGVVIVSVESNLIAQSRFYMEPVEAPND